MLFPDFGKLSKDAPSQLSRASVRLCQPRVNGGGRFQRRSRPTLEPLFQSTSSEVSSVKRLWSDGKATVDSLRNSQSTEDESYRPEQDARQDSQLEAVSTGRRTKESLVMVCSTRALSGCLVLGAIADLLDREPERGGPCRRRRGNAHRKSANASFKGGCIESSIPGPESRDGCFARPPLSSHTIKVRSGKRGASVEVPMPRKLGGVFLAR